MLNPRVRSCGHRSYGSLFGSDCVLWSLYPLLLGHKKWVDSARHGTPSLPMASPAAAQPHSGKEAFLHAVLMSDLCPLGSVNIWFLDWAALVRLNKCSFHEQRLKHMVMICVLLFCICVCACTYVWVHMCVGACTCWCACKCMTYVWRPEDKLKCYSGIIHLTLRQGLSLPGSSWIRLGWAGQKAPGVCLSVCLLRAGSVNTHCQAQLCIIRVLELKSSLIAYKTNTYEPSPLPQV